MYNTSGDGLTDQCNVYNLLPRQHVKMLLISLLYSSVAKVTGYVIVSSIEEYNTYELIRLRSQ